MKYVKKNLMVLLLLLGFITEFTIGECNYCKTGTCMVIQNCPEFYNIILTRNSSQYHILTKNHCGFHKNIPKICCPTNNNIDRKDYNETMSLLPKDCGKQMLNRIVGGNVTELDEYPWMALLEYETPKGIKTSCGGVLISNRYVLTAAHCLTKVNRRRKLVSVRLGEYNTATDRDCIADFCADDPISVGIEEQIVHEEYEGLCYGMFSEHNDIALLRLSRSVNFTSFIKPICLPSDENLNDKLIVSGWGTTKLSIDSSNVKMKVKLPLVELSYCQEKLPSKNIDDRQFCAGGEEGKDSCFGDSGGPIMHIKKNPVDNTMRWETVGIVSYGPIRCGTKGLPGVYTNAYHYMNWILSKIKP